MRNIQKDIDEIRVYCSIIDITYYQWYNSLVDYIVSKIISSAVYSR